MMRYALPVILALTACVPDQPKQAMSPMDRAANRYAAADYLLDNCAGWLGGYADTRRIAEDRATFLRAARKLGATDDDLAAGHERIRSRMVAARLLIGDGEACNQLAAELISVTS